MNINLKMSFIVFVLIFNVTLFSGDKDIKAGGEKIAFAVASTAAGSAGAPAVFNPIKTIKMPEEIDNKIDISKEVDALGIGESFSDLIKAYEKIQRPFILARINSYTHDVRILKYVWYLSKAMSQA